MSAAKAPSTHGASRDDGSLIVDRAKLDAICKDKLWLKDPRYFKKYAYPPHGHPKWVQIIHSSSGVDKGLRSPNGMPVEVMGLLHGHVDTDDKTTFIITDAFALPIEGTETTVKSDDAEVQNYMIALGESLEQTRAENFMGWYHSHPFDVGPHSNAFLSATDVSTQLGWQLPEDNAGNPWLALVVDPMRCVAKGKPEIGAFRCYPPAYTPPKGTAPDGVTWTDEKARNARWGESCISYYQLEVEYFVPSASSALLSILARDFMWTRVLSSTPMLEKETRDRMPDRLKSVTAKVDAALSMSKAGGHSLFSTTRDKGTSADLDEAATRSSELAVELCNGQAAQMLKSLVFNVPAASASAVTGEEGDASMTGTR